jgi:glycosyltransferase involved in cell wall biosynthesis
VKILLIGNYPNDRQESMARFVSVLAERLGALGKTVKVVFPEPVFGRILPASGGFGKWMGYLDKFLLFPFRLRGLVREADEETVVHICDHSNAMYGRYLSGKNWVLTCHDLLAVRSARGEFVENKTGWTGRLLQLWISSGIAAAPLLACVSESTRRDVEKVFPEKTGSIRVVRNGLNFPYRAMSNQEARPVLERLFGEGRIPESYILHVGAEVWYKNRGLVPEVFARLLERCPREGVKLVMVGPQTPALVEKVESLGFANRTRFLSGLESVELNALYSSAEAFLFPSLAEGFGWPVIEAMAAGCRVATSNRPPMSDFGKEVAELFDPEDANAGADALARILGESREAKHRRIRAGLQRAAEFSTEQMIEGYLRIYREALA